MACCRRGGGAVRLRRIGGLRSRGCGEFFSFYHGGLSWIQVANGCRGDDDYFSSDLSDDRLAVIWGRLEQPVLIVPSEKDEWVPAGTDVMGLVRKWMGFCKPGIASELSGLIPGANHRVENEAGQQWLADRVARFLAEIGK